ncbi:hypothetical protein HOK51_06795 [Candidatus Woesearchaeota archaeon]|jgi:hypothetical protein|nr:hypothetical protein [Candidatus Woesearchaeota archaeon]MBT6519530.1 hypothetical protein [Candidatus Woesearchaeota archaeon]MBT7367725.1 hypothetical protein [Candidatus Woesearchaeota archaeon]
MQKRRIFLVMCIILIFISSILLSGCSVTYKCADGSEDVNPKKCRKQYICFDGTKVTDSKRCNIVDIPKIEKQDAEKIASTYVNAYTWVDKITAKLISSYETEPESNTDDKENKIGNKRFIVTLIVQEKDNPYETIVEIDSVTGDVTCTKNCQYTKG